MSKLKDATMIDATEERKNRMNGESCLLTPHEAKIHDDIFINDKKAPKTCKNLYNYLNNKGYYKNI